MGAAERFLTQLLPHGCHVQQEVSGGIIETSDVDVAASLAYGNLSKPAYYFGRAKYCEDINAIGYITVHLKNNITKDVLENGWKLTVPRIEGIAKLIVYEGVFGISCNKCGGHGYLTHDKYPTAKSSRCEKCCGTGIGQASERKRSKITTIPMTSWMRVWRHRVDKFYIYVNELERELAQHLQNQFYNSV